MADRHRATETIRVVDVLWQYFSHELARQSGEQAAGMVERTSYSPWQVAGPTTGNLRASRQIAETRKLLARLAPRHQRVLAECYGGGERPPDYRAGKRYVDLVVALNAPRVKELEEIRDKQKARSKGRRQAQARIDALKTETKTRAIQEARDAHQAYWEAFRDRREERRAAKKALVKRVRKMPVPARRRYKPRLMEIFADVSESDKEYMRGTAHAILLAETTMFDWAEVG